MLVIRQNPAFTLLMELRDAGTAVQITMQQSISQPKTPYLLIETLEQQVAYTLSMTLMYVKGEEAHKGTKRKETKK